MYLQRNPRPVGVLIKYMLDIAMGMHYIADKGLVHRVSLIHACEIIVYYLLELHILIVFVHW